MNKTQLYEGAVGWTRGDEKYPSERVVFSANNDPWYPWAATIATGAQMIWSERGTYWSNGMESSLDIVRLEPQPAEPCPAEGGDERYMKLAETLVGTSDFFNAWGPNPSAIKAVAIQLAKHFPDASEVAMKRLEIATVCLPSYFDDTKHKEAAEWALARADALLLAAGVTTPAPTPDQ